MCVTASLRPLAWQVMVCPENLWIHHSLLPVMLLVEELQIWHSFEIWHSFFWHSFHVKTNIKQTKFMKKKCKNHSKNQNEYKSTSFPLTLRSKSNHAVVNIRQWSDKEKHMLKVDNNVTKTKTDDFIVVTFLKKKLVIKQKTAEHT